jgi:hypothetical protein
VATGDVTTHSFQLECHLDTIGDLFEKPVKVHGSSLKSSFV